MAKLIGNKPQQVPTNGDLGTMAFMDYDVVAPQFLAGGRRNLIINGAMQVAQRGTSFTGVTSNTYSTDRWQWNHGSGTFSLSQAGDGPSGFPTCYSMSCTSTGTTSSMQYFRQRFEGQHTYHLANGTPDAKTTTLSFWVKSNSVGTYPVLLVHHSSTQRHFVMTYTINQADTWEKKTFTIAGDTNGASINNTTMEMSLDFILSGNNGGATEATEVWKTRDTQSAANLQTAPAINGATGRYWNITGIQWELGTVATPFEHRSYGEELALCQRYFCKSFSDGVAPANGPDASNFSTSNGKTSGYTTNNSQSACESFPVTMRAAPSITKYGNSGGYGKYYTATNPGGAAWSSGAPYITTTSTNSFLYSQNVSGNTGYFLEFHWTADAEL